MNECSKKVQQPDLKRHFPNWIIPEETFNCSATHLGNLCKQQQQNESTSKQQTTSKHLHSTSVCTCNNRLTLPSNLFEGMSGTRDARMLFLKLKCGRDTSRSHMQPRATSARAWISNPCQHAQRHACHTHTSMSGEDNSWPFSRRITDFFLSLLLFFCSPPFSLMPRPAKKNGK